MQAFQEFREFVYGLRRRWRRRKDPKPLTTYEGLPQDVNFAALDQLCQQYFGEKALAATYQHLSAWKAAGAYRLFITLASGKQVPLIYKESTYAFTEIPALINFPADPGPAEFAVLSNAHAPLAAYLPRVYQAEEVIPKRHYRYILEDLGQDYRRTFQKEDLIQVAGLLPGLQEALCTWAETCQPDGLIQYGQDFSRSLQAYAAANLARFAKTNHDGTLHQVLREWDAISQTYLSDEFFTYPRYPIHGDSNYTNIHLHKEDAEQMKLVDWEWAGYGSPYADLVSLLKGAKEDVEKACYQVFDDAVRRQPGSSGSAFGHTAEENWRMYTWGKLERAITDAGFLAAQHLDTTYSTQFSLPRAISKALTRILETHQTLSG